MAKATALVAAIILVFGAFAISHSKTGDGLYHGSKVNLAVEQRQDAWWQQANREVKQRTNDRSELEGDAARVLYHGAPDLKELALTFDDGPHPGRAEKLVSLLDELNVKATFFVVGKMVEKHPELVLLEAEHGNEVEDHSFSHVNLSRIPEDEVETEYLSCKNLLKNILKREPRFCRPPGGRATSNVIKAAADCGLTTTMWSDDPKDYSNPGADEILQRTLDRAAPGGIILLHEGVEETMQILPNLVNTLRNHGYRFVTMSQLEADTNAAEASK